MSTSYIPKKQSLWTVWAANFTAAIAANPALYGLVAADATAISAVNTTAQQAYITGTTVATRTKATVAAKDLAIAQATVLMRSYAQIIQANQGVTPEAKADAGLTIRDTTPSRIPAPATIPILGVVAGQSLSLTTRFHDQNTPLSRAKPAGVAGLLYFAVTSATVINDPEVLPFHAIDTRNPVVLTFAPADAGKTAYIAARYYNAKGELGPWSAIVAATVMAA